MKKFIRLICVLAVFSFLTEGCNKNDNEPKGNTETNTTTTDGTETITSGSIIDLGLSVKWSNKNIGAAKPEEYGELYRWGDPTGSNSSTKWTDYPWTYSSICGTKYDIAHIQWGGSWKLPTATQMTELINCTHKFITYKGVNGMKFIGKNGNSIFLPCGGMWHSANSTPLAVGGSGLYWTGTNASGNACPDFMSFSESDLRKQANLDAACKLSIRPVQ